MVSKYLNMLRMTLIIIYFRPCKPQKVKKGDLQIFRWRGTCDLAVYIFIFYLSFSHLNFQNSERLRKSMRFKKRSWKREKQEKRITRMIILMILAFNICWTPYAFVCTLKLVHQNFVSDAWAVPGLLLAKRYLF